MTRWLLLWLYFSCGLVGVQAQPKSLFPPYVAESPGISADDAAERVRREVDGRILKVVAEGQVYRVRVLLASGVVTHYRVDAASGRVLPPQRKSH